MFSRNQNQAPKSQCAPIAKHRLLDPSPCPKAANTISLSGASKRQDQMDPEMRAFCFCSHCQGTGGDQANAIYLELTMMGFLVWYGECRAV